MNDKRLIEILINNFSIRSFVRLNSSIINSRRGTVGIQFVTIDQSLSYICIHDKEDVVNTSIDNKEE